MRIETNRKRAIISKDYLSDDILRLTEYNVPEIYKSIKQLTDRNQVVLNFDKHRIIINHSNFYIYEFPKTFNPEKIEDSDYLYKYAFEVELEHTIVNNYELLLFYRQLIELGLIDDFIIEMDKKLIDNV